MRLTRFVLAVVAILVATVAAADTNNGLTSSETNKEIHAANCRMPRSQWRRERNEEEEAASDAQERTRASD
jgi:hypothetical protein